MFEIRFYGSYNRYVVIGSGYPTSYEAGLHRRVSGDIVVESSTSIVPESDDWLFEWELKANPCYAERWQGKKLSGIKI